MDLIRVYEFHLITFKTKDESNRNVGSNRGYLTPVKRISRTKNRVIHGDYVRA